MRPRVRHDTVECGMSRGLLDSAVTGLSVGCAGGLVSVTQGTDGRTARGRCAARRRPASRRGEGGPSAAYTACLRLDPGSLVLRRYAARRHGPATAARGLIRLNGPNCRAPKLGRMAGAAHLRSLPARARSLLAGTEQVLGTEQERRAGGACRTSDSAVKESLSPGETYLLEVELSGLVVWTRPCCAGPLGAL